MRMSGWNGWNGWNYWGNNSWPYNYGYGYSSWPYNYNYANYSSSYPTYVSYSPGLSLATASPAWIYCTVPGRGPLWVAANHIPQGVMC